MENNYKIEFSEELNLFKVRLFADITESTVESCYQAYNSLVKRTQFPNGFKLLINHSGIRPTTERVHQRIQQLFSNQANNQQCIKVAVVNDGIAAVAARNSIGLSTVARFFSNEPEALVWMWS